VLSGAVKADPLMLPILEKQSSDDLPAICPAAHPATASGYPSGGGHSGKNVSVIVPKDGMYALMEVRF
jgi:hypothetical protein